MAGWLVLRISLLLTAVLVCPGKEVKGHDSSSKRSDDTSLSSLQTLVQQQAAHIQTLETRLTSTENRLATVENGFHAQASEISSLKDKQSKVVAFTVRFGHDNIPLSLHATLKFDKIVYNIGNGYDPHTGIFTAPVSGVYAFFLSEMASSGRSHVDLDLSIQKEGTMLDLVYAEGPTDNNDQGSSHVTTHLAKGQRVWVRQEQGDEVRGAWYTVFTGYLLHAD